MALNPPKCSGYDASAPKFFCRNADHEDQESMTTKYVAGHWVTWVMCQWVDGSSGGPNVSPD